MHLVVIFNTLTQTCVCACVCWHSGEGFGPEHPQPASSVPFTLPHPFGHTGRPWSSVHQEWPRGHSGLHPASLSASPRQPAPPQSSTASPGSPSPGPQRAPVPPPLPSACASAARHGPPPQPAASRQPPARPPAPTGSRPAVPQPPAHLTDLQGLHGRYWARSQLLRGWGLLRHLPASQERAEEGQHFPGRVRPCGF